MQTKQLCLILIIIFVIYYIFFRKPAKFTNNEKFDLFDEVGEDKPIFSKQCCGNTFYPIPGENNPDPNINKLYYPSNISHLGDGDSQQGCRCLTAKEINYLNSRGGNSYSYK